MYYTVNVDKIKVTEKNIEKIEGLLKFAQRKYKVRKADVHDVLRTADELSKMFVRFGVPMYMLKGTRYKVDPCSQNVPKKYKWKFESTVIELTHDGKGWALTDISREDVGYKYKPVKYAYVPYEVKKRIEKKVMEDVENGGY